MSFVGNEHNALAPTPAPGALLPSTTADYLTQRTSGVIFAL
jgi:hypothetical protein